MMNCGVFPGCSGSRYANAPLYVGGGGGRLPPDAMRIADSDALVLRASIRRATSIELPETAANSRVIAWRTPVNSAVIDLIFGAKYCCTSVVVGATYPMLSATAASV